MMKIAIVHDFLTKLGGAEKVLAAFSELYPTAPIFSLLYSIEGTRGIFEKGGRVIYTSSLNKYPDFIKRRSKFLLPRYSQAIEEFDFSEFDLVVSFSNSFAHGILTKPKTFHISYSFSPMRYVWDWYHEYLAENKIGFGFKGLFIRYFLHQIRLWDRVAADRVDEWLTQSWTAHNRLKKFYRVEAKVIYPPVDIEEIEQATEEPEDYCLIVSRLEPYKKIDLAIEVFNRLKRPLVIIGEGSDRGRLQKMAGKTIEFLGWQSDESVRKFMRNSYFFIFPGEEDFGIAPVEAMAAGRPIVAYKKGGATETVLEGKTGLFFDKPTAESLAAAVEKLSENYLNFSPDLCRRQAEKFSRKNFQEKIKSEINKSYAEWQKNGKS